VDLDPTDSESTPISLDPGRYFLKAENYNSGTGFNYQVVASGQFDSYATIQAKCVTFAATATRLRRHKSRARTKARKRARLFCSIPA
jgi:hypothetical protein